MATKSENSEIAVLQTQMTNVVKDISEIKADVKTLLGQGSEIEALKKEITEIKLELEQLRGRSRVQNILSGILASVLTLLITYFIQNVGQ